eukprot:SRR837773.20606.p1 GENE.SRR837773.20606~~SRR837773.20606.p1  ORF type:complete len:448 (-),score=201.00 SRR837773.20606:32-1291(-)
MEAIVQQIQALSAGGDGELKRLKDFLQGETETLKANAAAAQQAIAGLDRVQHTLGICYLLAAQLIHATPAPDHETFAYVSSFLRVADARQAQRGSSRFLTVCRCYAQMATEMGSQAMLRSLGPLRRALEALRPNAETWTPVHTEFLKVCLKCKAYTLAAGVLDSPVYDVEVPPTGSDANSTPQNFLSYFYYGAIVRIGLRQYVEALRLLLVVLTWPAAVASDSQADAYKKYVLVSLKVYGEVRPLPVYTSQVVMKLTMDSYDKDIVQAYKQGDAAALQTILTEQAAAIEADDNMELVREVVDSFRRHKLAMLTKTYLTLSLPEIAREVGLSAENTAPVEALLFDMISAGEVNARIEQTTGNVSFEEEPCDADLVMVGKMQARLQQILALGRRVAAFEQEVVSSEAYIKRRPPASAWVRP